MSTFNSALNSAATIYSLGIHKRYINSSLTEIGTVRIGRRVSLILAILAIFGAPFVARAPEGLYQLLQQLNGIFFIPIATVIIAAFFFPRVSAVGAKCGLVFGLLFYIIVNLIIQVDMHFVHIWGIEFVLNVILMHAVSTFYPRKNEYEITDVRAVDLKPWKYTRVCSAVLVVATLLIYLSLIHI